MQDTITSIVNKYDFTGKYLDNLAIKEINEYFKTAVIRLQIVEIINNKSARIIQEAATRLYAEQPELLRPGGNSYTTRRYSACLRDIEYYLRYSSYVLISGSIDILNERVLDGLRETYNSLNVPISPTIRSIQILEDIIINEFKLINNITRDTKTLIKQPFEYMIKCLSENDL